MRRFANKGWKVAALVAALVLIPTAAFAAIGAFTSSTTTAAVTGTNSSAAGGAKAVYGNQTGGGLNTRYGVYGAANGTAGIGVYGSGTKNGVVSNGPFLSNGNATIAAGKTLTVGGAATFAGTTQLNGNATIASGKTLTCTGCVSASDLSSGVGVRAKARVNSNATVVASTPGVTATNPSPGLYCLAFPAGVVTGDEIVIVSPDYLLSPDVNVETQYSGEGSGSCTGDEVIRTFGGPLSGPLVAADEGFELIVT